MPAPVAAAAAAGEMMAVMSAIKRGADESKSVVTKSLDAIKSAINSTADTFGRMKNVILDTVGAFQPFAVVMFKRAILDLQATFGQLFLPIVQRATVFVRALADTIYNLPGPVKSIISGIADLIVRFSGITAVIVAVVGGVVGAVTALTALGAAVVVLGVVTAALLPAIVTFGVILAPIAAIFTAIGAVIVGVAAGLVKLAQLFFNTAGGANLLNNLLRGFDQIMTYLSNTIAAAGALIQPIIDGLKSALSDLGDSLSELFDAIKPLIAAGVVAVVAVIASALALLAKGLTFAVRGINLLVEALNRLPFVRLLRQFEKLMPESGQKASSYGLGWAQARVESDPSAMYNRITEELLRNTRQGGGEPAEDPNKSVAKDMSKFADKLEKALDKYLSDAPGLLGIGFKLGRGLNLD